MQDEARRRRDRYAAELAAQIAADQAARRAAWQITQRRPAPGSRLPTPERGSERRAWPGGRRYDAAPRPGASGGARQAPGAARADGRAGDQWADGQLADRCRETILKEHAKRVQAHAEAGMSAAPVLKHGAERSGLLQASSDQRFSGAPAITGEPWPALVQLPLYPSFQEIGPQGALQGSGQHAGYPAGPRQPQPAHLQERLQHPSAQRALSTSAWTQELPTQAARPNRLPGNAVPQDVLLGLGPQLDTVPDRARPYAPSGQAAQPGDVFMHGARPGEQPGHAARPVRTPMHRRRSSVRMAQAGLEPGSGALAASGQQAARLRQQAAYRCMLVDQCACCIALTSIVHACIEGMPPLCCTSTCGAAGIYLSPICLRGLGFAWHALVAQDAQYATACAAWVWPLQNSSAGWPDQVCA